MENIKSKQMSRAYLEENRSSILEQYSAPKKRSRRLRLLTKKERKVLGIGKDRGLASVKNIRIAPVKVNLLLRNIRGKSVEEAYGILTYSPHNAAAVILKLLKSAEANAVNNNELSHDSLYISEAYVNPGPVIKRFRARARGSATRILKRTSHITLVVRERK